MSITTTLQGLGFSENAWNPIAQRCNRIANYGLNCLRNMRFATATVAPLNPSSDQFEIDAIHSGEKEYTGQFRHTHSSPNPLFAITPTPPTTRSGTPPSENNDAFGTVYLNGEYTVPADEFEFGDVYGETEFTGATTEHGQISPFANRRRPRLEISHLSNLIRPDAATFTEASASIQEETVNHEVAVPREEEVIPAQDFSVWAHIAVVGTLALLNPRARVVLTAFMIMAMAHKVLNQR